MEWMAFIRRNKAFVLLSVVIAVTVFGVLVFSVAASEDVVPEETKHGLRRFHRSWKQTLTDEQVATLKAIIEENRAEIQNQIEAWGVEFSELDDEQHEILKSMIVFYLRELISKNSFSK